jgi:hypothetical protein
MTSLLEAITRHLHSPEDFDVEAAAAEHHAKMMGRDVPLEERREEIRALTAGAGPDRHCIAG